MTTSARLTTPRCSILFAALLSGACGSGSPTAPDADDQVAPDGVPNGGASSDVNGEATTIAVDAPIACKRFDAAERDAIIKRVNAARSRTRDCGNERYAATMPVTWSTRLEDAARRHSDDMAQNNLFSHTGSDGSKIGARIEATGYRLRTAGENIAAGPSSDQEVLTLWLDSPGHCSNVMSPNYREMAMACSEDAGTDLRRYWTQVFAASP